MIHIFKEYQWRDNQPKFQTGDIITHKRYGNRGVIVQTDVHFQGDENWYLSNQTQPSKEKFWYFVLVDGNQQVTYVSEQNLYHDNSGILVVHPMLKLFFFGFDAELKRYIRNDVPWNPGQPPDAPPPLPPPSFQPPNPPAL